MRMLSKKYFKGYTFIIHILDYNSIKQLLSKITVTERSYKFILIEGYQGVSICITSI